MKARDADGVAAQAEERGVAEADHGAVAQDQVQADGRDGVDEKARHQVDQEALARGRRNGRHQDEQQQADRVDEGASGDARLACEGGDVGV
ncbi:hypothetical protein D3C72_1907740 [compost metagenome]